MSTKIIGVMSGSSIDGLDIALCEFVKNNGTLQWSLNNSITIPFSKTLQTQLSKAPELSGFDLMQLDASFGKFIGEQINIWAEQNKLTADLIASHGHTVFHEPGLGFTTQIGSGSHIAHTTQIDTITNFRNADVAAGGQGAPFAPVADTILFPGFDAYLNLGGIANINIITADGDRKAWDIGPCNQVLNFLANETGKTFDQNGELASKGIVKQSIVDDLVAMFPFEGGKPKGLSNEKIQITWIKYLTSCNEDVQNLLASSVEAITTLILSHSKPLLKEKATVFITGGGAHNTYLIDRLRHLETTHEIIFKLPSKQVIDFKECALMAYLGYLTATNQPYGIKNITGASIDTIGGAIHKAIR